MVNLSTILEMLFKRVEAQDILSGNVFYSDFGKDTFILLGRSYCQQYSNLELENLYDYFCREMTVQGERRGGGPADKGGVLNVFDALLEFAEMVLLEEGEEPVANYMHLLRWRMLSHMLEENLFTTAFLAYRDLKRRSHIREFGWKTIIGNNNVYLKQMLDQGLAENHFHLKGSAPYFQLSWIAMMNHINWTRYRETLMKYDRQRLSSNMHYSGYSNSQPLYIMHRQAALIRALLYARLTGKVFKIHECYVPSRQIREWMDYSLLNARFSDKIFLRRRDIQQKCEKRYMYFENLELFDLYNQVYPEKLKDNEILVQFLELFRGRKFNLEFFEHFHKDEISFAEFFDAAMSDSGSISLDRLSPFLDRRLYLELTEKMTREFVIAMLRRPDDIELNLTAIQSWIECEKSACNFAYGSRRLDDYALLASYEKGDSSNEYHQILSGERWLMYEMFKHIYAKTPGYREYNNLFYAYLIMKETIRAELVQVNPNIGFDNFSRYEVRKEDFIEDTEYEAYYTELALKEPMMTQNMVSLEARISPRNSAEENYEYIDKQDRNSRLSKDQLDKLYYVMHFVKKPDKKMSSGGIYGEMNCRHEELRQEVKRKALALAEFRERFPEKANRILGIDACNEEITCRPEVFAQAFRFLKNHSFIEKRQDCYHGINVERNLRLPELGITYHVGEDFLDIVDGLRAVNEAVLFLNMKCGDRIGHGLVLGIDVEEWYQLKNHRILISQQEYLDNLAWLYMKIKAYGLEHCQEALLHLETEYDKYFRKIYSEENICTGGYGVDAPMLQGISVYYEAWELRGDCPDCYFTGKYKKKPAYGYSWDYYGINSENPELKGDYALRHKREAAFLYYCYHYNSRVKQEGSKKKEIKIPRFMLPVIAKVQEHLLNEIAMRGIAIEANPSSNYLISTFQAYDRHPITRFYNLGLKNIQEGECPQIPVSINTDDQGVFGTSLENEYALMALALERMKDKNGKSPYTRAEVQCWLDNIRKTGIQYSFGNRRVTSE